MSGIKLVPPLFLLLFAGLFFQLNLASQPRGVSPTFVLPAPAQKANYRFAVIGDYGNNSAEEAQVASLVASWNPDFIITTGDNNYPDGEIETMDANIGQFYNQFIGNYQGQYGSGSPINRFWPSLGNHDWNSLDCNSDNCHGPYQDYFTLPGNERYYDVDYGLVHLFALDSDGREPDDNHPDSIQGNWLQNSLSASTSCFDIVYFHHPPYSSGDHGSNGEMQWPFATWGADVVMAGHDHTYERLDVNGTAYIVNGLGGKSLYDFSNEGNLPAGVASIVRYNDNFGAMLVTVTETGITMQFYNIKGALIDNYSVSKQCPTEPTATPSVANTPTFSPTPSSVPTDPPVTPTSLTATPTLVPGETPLPTATRSPVYYLPIIRLYHP